MRGTRFTPATPSAAGRVPTRVARHAGGSAPGDGCRTAPSISPHLALLSSITDCRTTGLVVISATSVLARLRRYDDRGNVQAIVRIESDPVARYCGLADSGQKYHIGALGVYCQCAVVRSLTGPCRWGASRRSRMHGRSGCGPGGCHIGEDCTNDGPVGQRAGPPAYPDPLALVGVWTVALPLADSSGFAAAINSSRLRSR
jgi:hypothetical protein